MEGKDVVTQLNNLRDESRYMQKGDSDSEIWKKDIEALDSAIALIKHYEKESTPILNREGLYICPCCKKKVTIKHTHCHWCGKKLKWMEVLRCKAVKK